MKKRLLTQERMAGVFPAFLNVVLTLALLIGSAAFPTSARADSIITVNSTADNTTPDGLCTLREAITNANNNAATFGDCIAGSGNDRILFASTLGTTTITPTSALPNINDAAGLTIDGRDCITLSGGDSVRVLYVTSTGILTLQHVSVTHGSTTSGGGGVMNYGTVTIANSTFSNNSATDSGGGVFNGGTLSISNSTFLNNSVTAGSGGGVANIGDTATITNSLFSNNSATGDGGGVTNYGTVTIANSTFSNNSATGSGGGVVNVGTAIITHSTFSGNSAGSGAGVVNNVGTATIANSTFSNNSATNTGGGVVNGGTLTISNSTFSDNSATYAGGGIFGASGIATLYNTIVANSTASEDCSGAVTDGGDNIVEDNTCGFTGGVDPNLGALTGSPAYFPLNAGSPAIDAGNDAVCAAAPVSNTSQNSLTRPQGPHCDIGSYERQQVTISIKSTGAQDGWVLESAHASKAGGSLDSASTTFRLGDDAAKKQYRGILSFSTGASLLDNAIITSVTLKVKRQGVTGGGNPVTMFQGFMVDIKKGFFGTAVLQAGDFQAKAHKSYGPFTPALSGGWYSIDLTSGKAYINKFDTLSGLTQIRLRFKLDDNNNAIANYLSLFSGDAPAASRPQLIIQYYVP
jgi:CSLREA domain-containing protein